MSFCHLQTPSYRYQSTPRPSYNSLRLACGVSGRGSNCFNFSNAGPRRGLFNEYNSSNFCFFLILEFILILVSAPGIALRRVRETQPMQVFQENARLVTTAMVPLALTQPPASCRRVMPSCFSLKIPCLILIL